MPVYESPRMSSPLPSYSVLIAAYNAEGFLSRAVETALAQTHPPLEVLIVDDASTDGTRTLVERLSSKDNRIRLIAMATNGGPSVARNAGIAAAKGEWIAVLDADDAYEPERVARMLSSAQALSADIVVDNFRFYRATGQTVSEPAMPTTGLPEVIPVERFVSRARPFTDEADWGLLKPIFRAAFLHEHRLCYPTHLRHGEDFQLLIESFLAGARYVLVREPGYLYTDRSQGFSRTKIDYGKMINQSAELMRDPRVVGNPVLTKSFTERIEALQRLKAERDVQSDLKGLWRERKYVGLLTYVLKHALTDVHFRRVVQTKVKSKLKR